MKYLNSFLKKNCSVDILPLLNQSNNPVKELSESYGAWKHLSKLPDFKNISLNLHIGDGSLALTGVLFSFLSNSFNISIDPNININKIARIGIVKNCYFYIHRFQDVNFNDMLSLYFQDKIKQGGVIKPILNYNIVLVHAHVDIKEIDKKFCHWRYIYVNLCCMENKQIFDFDYMKTRNISIVDYGIDNNILSDKNKVIVYKRGE